MPGAAWTRKAPLGVRARGRTGELPEKWDGQDVGAAEEGDSGSGSRVKGGVIF